MTGNRSQAAQPAERLRAMAGDVSRYDRSGDPDGFARLASPGEHWKAHKGFSGSDRTFSEPEGLNKKAALVHPVDL
jgi:hypothetical protein